MMSIFRSQKSDQISADLWALPAEGTTLVRDFVADRLAFARAHASWYRRKKRRVQNLSKVTRFTAISFLVLGGIMPLLDQAGISVAPNAGYVLLAIGGACLLADRIFGISAGWARYMVAAIDIEALAEAFRASVVATESAEGQNADAAIMKLCSTFTHDICAIVSSETKVWVQEFNNGREELHQMVPSSKI